MHLQVFKAASVRNKMVKVYHYSPSITRRDAIGYSLSYLHKSMMHAGIPSFLVCDQSVLGGAPPFTLGFDDFVRRKPSRDDILLMHYSFFDRNANDLLALPCRKILIYHNITPGHFFRDFGQLELGNACDAGRAYLARMSGAFEAVVADSQYNASELVSFGFPSPTVIPVFYNAKFYADGSSDHDAFLRRRLSGEVSLVFIGRFVPNKRPDNLIRVTAAVKKLLGRPVRLRLHGKVWDEGYFRSLRRLSEEAGVEHEISFEVNQPQGALRTSLASADAFVSMSEHEGFMVPLVEAFSAGCPVVALKSSAVTETCGSAGYLLDEPDVEAMAGYIAAITRDRDLRRNLIRAQSARAFDFSEQRTMSKWAALIQNFIPEKLVTHAHRI